MELLIMVLAPLPLSSIASLAVTNRYMLCTIEEIFHPFTLLRNPGNEFERALFLQHFEAHHPDEYICHACGTFHPRSLARKSFKAKRGQTAYICRRHREQFPEKVSVCSWDIHWLTFYKTMRAYRFTSSHGKPYNLNRFKSVKRGWSHETTAIPVGRHLLLRYRYSRCFEDPTDALEFGALIYELCPHYQDMHLDAKRFDKELQDAAETASSLPLTDIVGGYAHALHRCRHCPTEVLVKIHAGSLYPGRSSDDSRNFPYVASVTRYIDLGECKSPREEEWRALTERTGRANSAKERRNSRWSMWTADTNRQDIAHYSNETSQRDFTRDEPLHVLFERQLA